MSPKAERRIFLWVHAGLAVCVLLFPLYNYLMGLLPDGWGGCVVHDNYYIYCAGCGGTRAVNALLHLRLLDALRYNAIVTVTLLTAVGFDIAGWIRFFKHKTPILRVPPVLWILMASGIVVYFFLRNYLLVFHQIDPAGDLAWFWERFWPALKQMLASKGA